MTKETEKQINDLIMAMAKDPQNIDNYHKLSEFYLQMEDMTELCLYWKVF